jgi:tetratricopeptide (TPR) repeat protein
MDLLHRRHFSEAAEQFAELIERNPLEKELVDRARLHLAAARRGAAAISETPSGDELYHAAVFEKNRGNVSRALELVARSDSAPDPDGRFPYLAACCHALDGRPHEALDCLRRAIALSRQNRIHARLESDLTGLRSVPGFVELVGTP